MSGIRSKKSIYGGFGLTQIESLRKINENSIRKKTIQIVQKKLGNSLVREYGHESSQDEWGVDNTNSSRNLEILQQKLNKSSRASNKEGYLQFTNKNINSNDMMIGSLTPWEQIKTKN